MTEPFLKAAPDLVAAGGRSVHHQPLQVLIPSDAAGDDLPDRAILVLALPHIGGAAFPEEETC